METDDFCACGCGEPLPPRPRYIRGHKTLRINAYEVEDRGYITPCWISRKLPYNNGYVFHRWWKDGVRTRIGAHRIAYELANGPIPQGLVVDHLCRTRNCIRPDHLEAVSIKTNVRRTTQTKLNPEKVREIRASSLPNKELAEAYGVTRSLISAVRLRKIWVDI